MARAAALTTIAQWMLFKLIHFFHGAAPKSAPRNGIPLSRGFDKQR
jgi:hypothetical protein